MVTCKYNVLNTLIECTLNHHYEFEVFLQIGRTLSHIKDIHKAITEMVTIIFLQIPPLHQTFS